MSSSPVTWDPDQYGRFADERARPFADLVARIGADDPRSVVDLGCGPGPLTAGLALRWPGAHVEGVDSSTGMIERARALGSRVTFTVGDLVGTPTAGFDVVVSNAALQWVPDHLEVLTRWAGALGPGGWLAVQVPGNFDAPSHTLLREVAALPRFADPLRGVLRSPDLPTPGEYASVLLAAGLHADVWETTYLHVLHGRRPVLEWMRGTALRPVFDVLPGGEVAAFETELASRLEEAYPATAVGTVLPFRRVFAVGHRSA